MSLKAGIVGLPNVGKSTLFKALTRKQVDISNYPFCTIEPNVGVVEVPDARLTILGKISNSVKVVAPAVEFVDIAGLVKGASEGEGLGNKFLSHIREVDAIIQVVRVFENPNITHVHNQISPIDDIVVINTELILADMDMLGKRKERLVKDVRAGKKEAAVETALIERIQAALDADQMASTVTATLTDADERKMAHDLQLLTAKPFLYVYNVSDIDRALAPELESRPHVKLDIKIEEELIAMTAEEAAEMGMSSHIDVLITAAYELLGLMTYFTTGETETRGWTIPRGSTAPQAGAAIHTDFAEKFIRAEVVGYDDFVQYGGWSGARDNGKFRLEGKEYIVKDGDLMVFKV